MTRRFLKDSKGISTAIGTILLVLAMFVISSNVFMWTISQNTVYSESVRESHQTDADRSNEKIVASNGNYTVVGGRVKVEAKLTNTGTVAAQIKNLWVFDTTIQKYGFNDTMSSLNLNLNPGQTMDLTGSEAIWVSISDASYVDTFNSWFVTARGNTVAVEEPPTQGTIIAEVAQGIGYLGMDFDTFRYYEYASDNTLKDYPDGSGSYIVPTAQQVVFRIKLTNYDPSGGKRPLTLNSHSLIWMYYPTVGKQVYWHIVNVDGTGTVQPTYSDITIGYKETVFVYFASKSDGTFIGNPDKQKPGTVGPAALNLLLLGMIGAQEYGQNIPFVSVYCI